MADLQSSSSAPALSCFFLFSLCLYWKPCSPFEKRRYGTADGVWNPLLYSSLVDIFVLRVSFCVRFIWKWCSSCSSLLALKTRGARCLCLPPVRGGLCPLNVLDLSGNSHPSLGRSERLWEFFRLTVEKDISAPVQHPPFILFCIKYFHLFFSTEFIHHCNAALLSRSLLNMIL